MLTAIAALAVMSSGDIKWAASLNEAKEASRKSGRLIMVEISSPT